MIRWRRGVVTALGRSLAGRARARRRRGRRRRGARRSPTRRWSATPEVGDAVLLNVGALELGLGTGGYALVVALPDRLPPDRDGPRAPGQGALHAAAGGRARRRRAGRAAPRAARRRRAAARACRSSSPTCTPRCPACSPGVLAARPGTRVAYVMTDGGALPLWFCRTVAALRDRARRHGDGRAGVRRRPRGGHACTPGLLAAVRVLGAEVVVVTQGPGNLGTGTPWGFSGRRGRRGGQRRRRGRRPAGRGAAHVGGRPAASATAASATTAARRTAGSRSPPADVVVPASCARPGRTPRRLRPAPRWSRSTTTGCSTCCGRGRRCCRRWAAGSTTTRWRSSPRPRPAGTPRPCSSGLSPRRPRAGRRAPRRRRRCGGRRAAPAPRRPARRPR